jgi:hypothetical protein
MVRDHPTICQIDIFLELNGEHFRIDLNDRTLEPIADAVAFSLMITEHFNAVANFEGLLSFRSTGEI